MNEEHENIPERDRLPVMQWLTYSFEGETVDVILVLSEKWPDVTVRLRPRGRGVEIRGTVRPDGRVRYLAIETDEEDGEVTGGAAHSLPGIVSSLKEWNAVARDMAGQILEGASPDRTIVDAKPATDGLRALFYDTGRPQGTRRRGADAELMLRQVVDAYTGAVQAGDPTPRKTVAAQFGYTPEHISRLLKRARQARNGKPPLLQDQARQPIVAAIVTSPLGVLVGRRNDRTPPWTFIAGEVEPGEQPEDAAIREVKEETGLEVRAGQVIGERDHPATGRHMIYLAAEPVRGTEVFVGDEAELAEVRWVSLAEADELLPGMFEPVREHLARELGEAQQ